MEAPRPHTPRWGFEPWISKDISDGPDTRAFLAGFEERDIPVGVVVLDSPWDENYTTFRVNEARYDDFAGMVRDFASRGVRVVLWTTQMVNEESFDLEEGGDTYPNAASTFRTAKREGYLINGGETYFWWKGKGAGVDFFNPEAVAWWRGLQDNLLDLGVVGWKLDFGDSYIPTATVATAAGIVTHQEYSEAYYRDFWEHAVERRGQGEAITMVRGWDESYQHVGRYYARPEHAPVIWAGDNRRDWFGLEDAMHHMFQSAAAGYAVVGSDIGGYLDRDDKQLTVRVPFDLETFQAWTMVGALTPFMQLHGRANLSPWTVPEGVEETVQIYREWSWLHTALIPFFYSLAEAAHAGGPSVTRPVGGEENWSGDYRFTVGDALLVAPYLEAGGARDVLLPEGAWRDWWSPEAEAMSGMLEGWSVGPGRIPLFVREGGIVPLEIDRGVLGLPEPEPGVLTILVQPGDVHSELVLHDEGEPLVLSADGARLELERVPRTVRVWFRGATGAATLDGAPLGASAFGASGEGTWADETGVFARVTARGQRAVVAVP